jgi:hypothetical protein
LWRRRSARRGCAALGRGDPLAGCDMLLAKVRQKHVIGFGDLPGGTGLPALEPEGVPVAPVPDLSLIFFFSFTPPSEASPAVASPSLVAPPMPLGRPGSGVPERLPTPALEIFTFLRLDSFPLDSERLGDPGRFRAPFLVFVTAFCFPEGVLVPLVAAPEPPASLPSAFF